MFIGITEVRPGEMRSLFPGQLAVSPGQVAHDLVLVINSRVLLTAWPELELAQGLPVPVCSHI